MMLLILYNVVMLNVYDKFSLWLAQYVCTTYMLYVNFLNSIMMRLGTALHLETSWNYQRQMGTSSCERLNPRSSHFKQDNPQETSYTYTGCQCNLLYLYILVSIGQGQLVYSINWKMEWTFTYYLFFISLHR